MFFRVHRDKCALPDLVRGSADGVRGHRAGGEGRQFVFGTLEALTICAWTTTPRSCPPKKFFFPPPESAHAFRDRRQRGRRRHEVKVAPTVLFGLHPCDINALMLMDNVFLGDNGDPYYKARRDNTLIVGVSCMPPTTVLLQRVGDRRGALAVSTSSSRTSEIATSSRSRSVKGAELSTATSRPRR